MSNYIINPVIILREEFDDWAILFDPDTGNAHGVNPIGVFIWKRLDGFHSEKQILSELREICEDMPENAQLYVYNFIMELVEKGYAGIQVE